MWFIIGLLFVVFFAILWSVITGHKDAYEEWRDEHDI
jgi:uncharacterized membrane protein YjfL (UPF0719 family)